MSEIPPATERLAPLPYHAELVSYLKDKEPHVWTWGTSDKVRDEQSAEMRTAMLRETYRLEPEAHADIHSACQHAMTALGIVAPVTLYQAGGSTMNAALCYIPGEVHLVFYGSILEKLSRDELIALLGHELAHYQLWSMAGGVYHAANSILDHTIAYAEATASHVETERLYALHTELFADRGAAIAAGGAAPAITLLLKTVTGIPNPDAAAYLRQAAELEKNPTPSQGISHPEIFLRAQAVDKWWRGEAGTEEWIKDRLFGPLSLGKLDVLRQLNLSAMTERYYRLLLADAALRSDAVETEIRALFPYWKADGESLTFDDLAALQIDDSVRDYFAALTFDLAMADADVREAILSVGAQAAAKMKGLDAYRQALRRDLKLTKPVIERITAHTAKNK
jgi:hypothetical protein